MNEIIYDHATYVQQYTHLSNKMKIYLSDREGDKALRGQHAYRLPPNLTTHYFQCERITAVDGATQKCF